MSDELHYQPLEANKRVITPQELEAGFKLFKDDCISKCIIYINRILLSDEARARLLLGQEVSIRDESNYHMWRVGCHDAVKLFADAGWGVKEIGGDFGINNNFEFSLKAVPNAE